MDPIGLPFEILPGPGPNGQGRSALVPSPIPLTILTDDHPLRTGRGPPPAVTRTAPAAHRPAARS
ncbi:hypothetical protein ACSR0Z_27015 [Streptomyces viridosporus]